MKGSISDLMQQAQKMQADMQKAQEELARAEVQGEAGAGLVKVIMTGRHDVKRLVIDDAVLGEYKEVLEDLLVAAFNDAAGRVDQTVQEETQKLMGDIKLPPGMKLPF